MKIAYFDCHCGAAGDMIVGALVDAGAPIDAIRAAVDALDLPTVTVDAAKVKRAGFAGTKFDVAIADGDHEHRSLDDINRIVTSSSLGETVKTQAVRVFRRLAEAEAEVHGRADVEHAHFHEVGAKDAIVDVVGACVALESLGVDEVLFSTVTTGGGTIECAHGILPVPAPATLALLKGVPTREGDVQQELVTPTGAALLTTLGRPSGAPEMTVDAYGCGAGSREAGGRANLLRVRIGTKASAAETASDGLWVLETNVDDMPPEQVAYAVEKILAAGAADVFVTPVQMKKGRPGLLLTALAADEQREALAGVILEHTTTLGVRMHRVERRVLAREVRTVSTSFGDIRVKVGMAGDRVLRVAPEFEDCRRAADRARVPLDTICQAARAALDESSSSGFPPLTKGG